MTILTPIPIPMITTTILNMITTNIRTVSMIMKRTIMKRTITKDMITKDMITKDMITTTSMGMACGASSAQSSIFTVIVTKTMRV